MAETLNHLNYLNLAGYILNSFITFFAASILHLTDISPQSASYQTLINPAPYAFSIWGIIFLSQGIYTAAQMHPSFRKNELVQDGVKYWYFVTCVMQSSWVFIALGTQQYVLSTLAMIGILIGLIQLLESQYKLQLHPSVSVSIKEFWLFQFPFEIHCGWIYAATAITLNSCVIRIGAGAELQYLMALLTIAMFIFIPLRCLQRHPKPNYTIPLVLAWAAHGIFQELTDPKDTIVETFSEMEIYIVQIFARMLCVGILLGVMVSIIRNRVMKEMWRLGYSEEQERLRGANAAPMETYLA